MQQVQNQNLLRIDLSHKSEDEINDYLQILLAVRYKIHQLGHEIKIEPTLIPVKTKIFQA